MHQQSVVKMYTKIFGSVFDLIVVHTQHQKDFTSQSQGYHELENITSV